MYERQFGKRNYMQLNCLPETQGETSGLILTKDSPFILQNQPYYPFLDNPNYPFFKPIIHQLWPIILGSSFGWKPLFYQKSQPWPIDPHSKTLHSLTHTNFLKLYEVTNAFTNIYLYSHDDTTMKSVGGIFMRRSLLQVQLYPVCSEAKQSFQFYPRWNCTFSWRTYSWISKIHCPALQRTKPKKWGVQPVIPKGLKSFQNIRIPKQTSSLSVCF